MVPSTLSRIFWKCVAPGCTPPSPHKCQFSKVNSRNNAHLSNRIGVRRTSFYFDGIRPDTHLTVMTLAPADISSLSGNITGRADGHPRKIIFLMVMFLDNCGKFLLMSMFVDIHRCCPSCPCLLEFLVFLDQCSETTQSTRACVNFLLSFLSSPSQVFVIALFSHCSLYRVPVGSWAARPEHDLQLLPCTCGFV